MSDKALEGKVAIITGGAGGIGRKFAEALGGVGADVVLADIDGGAIEAARADLSGKGFEVMGCPTDITSESSVNDMAAAVISRFGGIDILVNNAALMADLTNAPLMKYPLEEWERVLRVNLTGALLCIRAVVPSMRERGRGKIINTATGGAFLPANAYGISKLALLGLNMHMASELGRYKINVNAIAPGMILTEAGEKARPAGMLEMWESSVPLKTMGDPEDLCGALVFLSSAASDWVTGQIIGVDGGWIKRF
ncbi:SDR family oxidoreductase [Chloroflexota bacterium]